MRSLILVALFLVGAVSEPPSAHAQPAADSTGGASPAGEPAMSTLGETPTLSGIDFGVGISVRFPGGSNERIVEAELVNGIVRVTKEEDALARLMAETHYFFSPNRPLLGWLFRGRPACIKYKVEGEAKTCVQTDTSTRVDQGIASPGDWGFGPFLAFEPGSDDIIEAVALGIMVGLRRHNNGKPTQQSFNVGVGYAIDPNVRLLGDGIRKNEELPEGETEIRFKTKSQRSLVVLVSFSW